MNRPINDVKNYDGGAWSNLIDINLEERRVDRASDSGYAIYSSANYEATDEPDIFAPYCSDASYAGMKKCVNYIDTSNPKIKTMTRKERGILGLYMYWKCGVIIDKASYTFCTGSRYGVFTDRFLKDLSGGVPGAHWDMTPNLNRFCSFSNGSSEAHDKTLRPREVSEGIKDGTGLMQKCTGIGCYRRPGI
jgi:hypothetical protein